MRTLNKKKTLFINIAFAGSILVLLFFLSKAPEVSTPKLPHDEDHNRFFSMKKKAAGKLCVECHTVEETDEIHKETTPNTNRCLFCHRRD